jgi:flagellar basal-body rod protein FlgB
MTSIDFLHSALNGLMTRQSVIADNIANASTPGYQANQVDFETALRDALNNDTAAPMDPATVSPTNDPSNQDGNNVNLEAETMSLSETELRYQAVVNAINGQFSILKTSIEG